MKKGNALVFFLFGALVFALGVLAYLLWQNQQLIKRAPLTYEECIKIPGAVILQSYPGQCVTPDKRSVWQPLSDEEKKKLQPPDETTNWKTYSDSKLGFSINHPADFVQDTNKNGVASNFAAVFVKGTAPVTESSITIDVDNDPRNGETRSQTNPKGDKITKPEDSFALAEGQFERLQVQGFPAAKFTIKSREGESTSTLRILRNGTLWNITGWIQSPTSEKIKIVDQILSTFKFTDGVTAQTSNVQVPKLNYALPAGWQTATSNDGRIEAGYDPSKNQILSENNITGISLSGIWSTVSGKPSNLGYRFSASISPYDGGSRHTFLYKKLNFKPYGTSYDDYPKNNFEREFSYNGWNCLVLFGIDVSQWTPVWGMCPISKTEALNFTMDGDEELVKQQIQTLKILK